MNFISFDLETTGIVSHRDRIVEIGACRFVDGKFKDSYQQLVSIDIPMPAQASAINKITDDMLKDQPKIQDVLPKFAEFCGEDLMVAHNSPFDFQFLLRVIEEHHTIAPKGLVLDTCQLSRKSFLGLANYKLSTLCEYLKIDSKNLHRAGIDALCCGKLFVHILKKNNFSVKRPDEIITFSDKKALKFPNVKTEGQLNFL